jgi:hypothetical protein
MVQLKKIGIYSCAKVMGILYAAVGLIFGVFISLFSLALGSLAHNMGESGGFFGALFGVGSIIILPIFYGVLGFVAGAIMAWVYNMVAQSFGGVEMEFEDTRVVSQPPAAGTV